jgi:hypothetical protein
MSKASGRAKFFGKRKDKAIEPDGGQLATSVDPKASRDAAWEWIWQTDGIFGTLDFLSDFKKSKSPGQRVASQRLAVFR